MSSLFYGFTKRILLFQFFFIFAFLKFKDMSSSSYELKDKYYELATSFNFKNAKIEEFISNPLLAFQIFVGFQTLCAVLALFNSKFFAFLSATCLTVTNFVYFNPFRINPTTKKPEISFTDFKVTQLQTVPLEFLLLLALTFAILAHSFTSSKCQIPTTVLVEEAGATGKESTKDKREAKVSSKKRI